MNSLNRLPKMRLKQLAILTHPAEGQMNLRCAIMKRRSICPYKHYVRPQFLEFILLRSKGLNGLDFGYV